MRPEHNDLLEDALIELGVSILAAENPDLSATEQRESLLRRRAIELLTLSASHLRRAICEDSKVRPTVKAGTSIAISAAIMASGDWAKHFPAQAAANALVIFGLGKFCKGELPQ